MFAYRHSCPKDWPLQRITYTCTLSSWYYTVKNVTHGVSGNAHPDPAGCPRNRKIDAPDH